MRHIIRDSLHPSLHDLYELWAAACGARAMPTWEVLSKVDLRRWQSSLVLIEVSTEADQTYRYRYYGSRFVELFGKDMTGRSIDSLPEEQQTLIRFEYGHACAKKRPTWRVYSGDFDGDIVTWQRLILPISADGERVDMLLVGAYETKRIEA